jgi:predicted enzyme related to lactoylglutathione lyase
MLTLGSSVLGVNDIARATAFWSGALGYEQLRPGDDTWVILVPKGETGEWQQRGAGRKQLALMLSETPVQDHPRIHFDLYADDQEAEIERLLELGASCVEWDLYPDNPDFIVLADTEGNRFCVVDLQHEE